MEKERSDFIFDCNIKSASVILKEMLDGFQDKHPYLRGVLIDPDALVFEERILMNCYYCGKYNNNWKCPPNLPEIDYKKMISEFENAALIYVRIPLDEHNYDEVRSESSVILHRILLEFEKYLWNHNNSTALSFIGGSCKLCKNGCGKEKCSNPYMARSPFEALGINIIKTAFKYGIDISFPPADSMLRMGLLLW